jgi:hypothetical protein
MNKKTYTLPVLGLALLIFSLYFSFSVFAQTAKSNCVVTKIGNPGDQKPNLPPECQTNSIDGLQTPPNLQEHPVMKGYFRMPDPDDDSYRLITSGDCLYGSPELISVLYTVAKKWKEQHPQGYLFINDLNGPQPPHASHKWGRGVDLVATTDGIDRVADMTENYGPYNRIATVELGQLFASTNKILNIWYNDTPVRKDVLDFANDPKNPNRSAGMNMEWIKGHDNHFHVDINLEPLLSTWAPSC